jgi:hypothetical protein
VVSPLTIVLRKVFETWHLSPDFTVASVKKSCFQRTICAKYSKDMAWRVWADPDGVEMRDGSGVAPCVYYTWRVKRNRNRRLQVFRKVLRLLLEEGDGDPEIVGQAAV